jgi:hypothetical protein
LVREWCDEGFDGEPFDRTSASSVEPLRAVSNVEPLSRTARHRGGIEWPAVREIEWLAMRGIG